MTVAVPPMRSIDHPTEHLVRGLHTAVEGALWNHGPLRSSRALVDVGVTPEGVVTLRGTVISEILKSMATRIAARVPGVTAVSNELVTDSETENTVADLLSRQATQLFTDQLQVESRQGVVYVGGTVVARDPEAANASFQAARGDIQALPGIRQVIFEVDVVAGGDELLTAADDDVADAAAGSGADQAVIQERLRVWKERAATPQ